MDVDEPVQETETEVLSQDLCVEMSNGCRTNVILDCGHPCLMCIQQQNIPVRAFTRDHTYHQTSEAAPNDNQCKESTTELTVVPVEVEPEVVSETVMCSTPVKVISEMDMDVNDVDDMANLSELSSFRDDPHDKTYEQSDLDIDSDIDMDKISSELDLIADKKYIVFGSCIRDLLVRLRCPECDSAVDPDDICQDETDNAMFRCSVYCLSGHLIVRWASQPVLGKMAAGNLLTCAAILFSGQTYTHVSQFASF